MDPIGLPSSSNGGNKILARCPRCGESAEVPVKAAGRQAGCNRCGTRFVIPAPHDANTTTIRANLSDVLAMIAPAPAPPAAPTVAGQPPAPVATLAPPVEPRTTPSTSSAHPIATKPPSVPAPVAPAVWHDPSGRGGLFAVIACMALMVLGAATVVATKLKDAHATESFGEAVKSADRQAATDDAWGTVTDSARSDPRPSPEGKATPSLIEAERRR